MSLTPGRSRSEASKVGAFDIDVVEVSFYRTGMLYDLGGLGNVSDFHSHVTGTLLHRPLSRGRLRAALSIHESGVAGREHGVHPAHRGSVTLRWASLRAP